MCSCLHKRSVTLWMTLLWAAAAFPSVHGGGPAPGLLANITNECNYTIEGSTSMRDTFKLEFGESQTFPICSESRCDSAQGTCKGVEWGYQANMVDYPNQIWNDTRVATICYDVNSGLNDLIDMVTLRCDAFAPVHYVPDREADICKCCEDYSVDYCCENALPVCSANAVERAPTPAPWPTPLPSQQTSPQSLSPPFDPPPEDGTAPSPLSNAQRPETRAEFTFLIIGTQDSAFDTNGFAELLAEVAEVELDWVEVGVVQRQRRRLMALQNADAAVSVSATIYAGDPDSAAVAVKAAVEDGTLLQRLAETSPTVTEIRVTKTCVIADGSAAVSNGKGRVELGFVVGGIAGVWLWSVL